MKFIIKSCPLREPVPVKTAAKRQCKYSLHEKLLTFSVMDLDSLLEGDVVDVQGVGSQTQSSHPWEQKSQHWNQQVEEKVKFMFHFKSPLVVNVSLILFLKN